MPADDRSGRGLAFFAPSGSERVDRSYWALSTRPLHILMFLLPLLILYEVGAATSVTRISAETLLSQFFSIFGVAAIYVPGFALITVLLVWHIFSGDRWAIDIRVLPAMLVESVLWTLPLIVFGAALGRLAADHAGGPPPAVSMLLAQPNFSGMNAEDLLRDLPWQARLTVAIGAGLYEEMLFRLVGIALLHFVLKDLLGVEHVRASILAVAGSAVAFALYHDIGLAHGVGAINWRLAVFALFAGIFFGTVYIMRGFGIVVGAHALYDVAALLLLAPAAAS